MRNARALRRHMYSNHSGHYEVRRQARGAQRELEEHRQPHHAVDDIIPDEAEQKIADVQGDVFHVESITNHRLGARWEHHRFLVKWLNYAPDKSTWEPAENFLGDIAKSILRRYCEEFGIIEPQLQVNLYPDGNPLEEIEMEWQNFGQETTQLHPNSSCMSLYVSYSNANADSTPECKCSSDGLEPHFGCLYGTLNSLQTLLPSRESLVDEFSDAYHSLQSRNCGRNLPYTRRCFEESLNEGCFRVAIKNRSGVQKFAYYRSLPDMLRHAFKYSTFLHDFVPLPAKFARVTAETARPAKYHFCRDFNQPCWRSPSGPNGVTYWVNQLVWLIDKQTVVRVIAFVKDADVASADGGHHLASAPVKVIVECNSFWCHNNTVIKRRTADMAPVAQERVDITLISRVPTNMFEPSCF
jgi:hypothetical protein